MAITRSEGAVQPGWKWGPFTTRIPGIHIRLSVADMIQGGLIIAGVSGGLVPIYQKYFGVSFDIAWSLLIIHMFWVGIVPTFLLGEPYSPGWITPVLPIVLLHFAGLKPGIECIHYMMACMISLSAIMLFFGFTGLGKKFFGWVPDAIKAGIILGGGIAALQGEVVKLPNAPFSFGAGWLVCFLLIFSVPIIRLRSNKVVRQLLAWGFLLGYVAAGLAGWLSGELKWAPIQWKFFVPDFNGVWAALSPWGVGFPPFEMYYRAFPLALVAYVIGFGDMVVASSLVQQAAKKRPDETVVIDHSRTHFSIAIRNMGLLLTGGVFPAFCGVIYTGAHAFLCEKYGAGRKVVDSIFDTMCSFNFVYIVFALFLPIILLIKPILPAALSLTLILTGFACAFVGVATLQNTGNTSKGIAIFMAVVIAKYGAAWGLGAGIICYLLMIWRPKIENDWYGIK